MTLFLDGISEARPNATAAELLQDIEQTEIWAKEHETSLIAPILYAMPLMDYGG